MEKRSFLRDNIARIRGQRWTKEVLLAVLLTIAAAAFIATAMVGRGGQDGVPVETARTPQR
jgi:hypothetical protein